MPGLQTITFNGSSATAYKPELVGPSCWRIRVPDSFATPMAANTTTTISSNFNVTIPTGYFLLVLGVGLGGSFIAGAPNCSARIGIYTGSATIQVNVLNTGAATPTPTSGAGMARMILLRSDIKQSIINAI